MLNLVENKLKTKFDIIVKSPNISNQSGLFFSCVEFMKEVNTDKLASKILDKDHSFHELNSLIIIPSLWYLKREHKDNFRLISMIHIFGHLDYSDIYLETIGNPNYAHFVTDTLGFTSSKEITKYERIFFTQTFIKRLNHILEKIFLIPEESSQKSIFTTRLMELLFVIDIVEVCLNKKFTHIKNRIYSLIIENKAQKLDFTFFNTTLAKSLVGIPRNKIDSYSVLDKKRIKLLCKKFKNNDVFDLIYSALRDKQEPILVIKNLDSLFSTYIKNIYCNSHKS